MGPFQALGKALNTVGTIIDAVDNVATRSAKLIDIGFDAIEIPTNNMLADLQCDSIVDDANRDIRIMNARAEADAIRASVKPTPRRSNSTKAKTTK